MVIRIGIIFARSWLPFSLLIQATTVSRWSHCGLIIKDRVYEAVACRGVVLTNLEDFQNRYRDCTIVWTDIPEVIYSVAESQIGKPYDWLGVLGIAISRNWQEDDYWFCSEYIAWCLFNCGIEIGDPWRITPGHLYNFLLERVQDANKY